MSDIERDVAMPEDDASVFAEALNDAPETEAQVAQETAQPRDDAGRFAPKAEEREIPVAQPERQDQGESQREGWVPSHRVKEEADARRSAESQLTEMRNAYSQMQLEMQQMRQAFMAPQKPQEAPEVWSDPDAWVRHQFSQQFNPIQQQLAAMQDFNAQQIAEIKFGEEVAKATQEVLALKASGRLDPADEARIASAPNRYMAAVEFSRRQRVFSEVGTDPEAYFNRRLEAMKADPAFRAQIVEMERQGLSGGQQRQNNITRLPPSLTKQPGSGANAPLGGDESDKALLSAALKRG